MSDEAGSSVFLEDETHQYNHDSLRIVKDLFAGTTGGIAQVLVGQPFDTTKVRLQTSTAEDITTMKVIKDLVKHEGLKGFYKGTLTPLIGVGACVSVQFGVNEYMKRLLKTYNKTYKGIDSKILSLPQYYACGLTGGLVNSFLSSPIEHIRIRLQIQKNSGKNAEFSGPLDCIKKLLKQKQLMRGLPVMMVRAGHGLGVYFLVYEALIANQIKKKSINREDIKSWRLCLYGATAGTLLWIAVYPIDVIKSIIQSDNLKSPKYGTSLFKVGRQLYLKEGLPVFFKGLLPTMLRATPANAVTFTVFETSMRLMG
ncbi:hypothetical protein TPHA_0A03660 [Tetrapisispora phaffii CBS 4417]|uniref:Carrier protein YMC1, mitochondrial n=1 Tax=Tetrapisispora phaffii (strain ATCC 24235 / CBS 4417 / NBRC 1672 / NRRL Y-8282 / UCD 70-5) TaxID=1071381 RepID=G8BNG4_TETPH|nr:hypothetical protein TPHA_0A03660 [Tetrapisispora phaffii CBS 4417]CCE61442.1 hypothetical protein TPHA_0A03660 [Tetrapisispora phaffii CBS 4417]